MGSNPPNHFWAEMACHNHSLFVQENLCGSQIKFGQEQPLHWILLPNWMVYDDLYLREATPAFPAQLVAIRALGTALLSGWRIEDIFPLLLPSISCSPLLCRKSPSLFLWYFVLLLNNFCRKPFLVIHTHNFFSSTEGFSSLWRRAPQRALALCGGELHRGL